MPMPPMAADRDRDAELVEGGELGDPEPLRLGDPDEGGDEADVLDRQEDVGDPAVVLVVLEPLDHVVRRVGAVEAGEQVDRRDDAQDDDRPDPEPHAPAGQLEHPERDEGQRRDHQADQPEVALLVRPLRAWSPAGTVLAWCRDRHRSLLLYIWGPDVNDTTVGDRRSFDKRCANVKRCLSPRGRGREAERAADLGGVADVGADPVRRRSPRASRKPSVELEHDPAGPGVDHPPAHDVRRTADLLEPAHRRPGQHVARRPPGATSPPPGRPACTRPPSPAGPATVSVCPAATRG